jgi:tetratricopeptide (TPR) repeat protein
MPPTSIARQSLEQLRAAFISAVARGDWNVALHNAEKALSIVGDHPTVIGALALCQSRLGRLEEALKNYRIATSLAPDDFNLFDGLAVACGHAGDSIGARAAGMTALTLRDKQRRAQTWRLPATLPPPLSNDRSRNVIAYSVFGSDPKYCETAVLNVSAARAAFPCWTTRFYLDISSTPPNIAHRLRAAGAEVVETSRESLGGLPPLLWRFQVMDDPAVDRWLIRDADSLLSVREAVAVQRLAFE